MVSRFVFFCFKIRLVLDHDSLSLSPPRLWLPPTGPSIPFERLLRLVTSASLIKTPYLTNDWCEREWSLKSQNSHTFMHYAVISLSIIVLQC